MIKRILMNSFLIGLFLLCGFMISDSANNNDIRTIIDYMNTKELNAETNPQLIKAKGKWLLISEVNVSGFDYKYRWDIHYFYYDKERNIIQTTIKKYKDFVSPRSRGFTYWSVNDSLDGKIDAQEAHIFSSKGYEIVICHNEEDGCRPNHILFIDYPEGYINKDWYQFTVEEAQEIFDKEIEFWINLINNTKVAQ